MSSGKWISSLTATTPLEDAARRVLLIRLDVVRDYLPLALQRPEEDPEYVHQLRVGTRRVGSALDIFSPCLPDRVYRAAKKRLRNLRRSAGAARDWDVFLAGLAQWLPQQSARHKPGVTFLIGYAFSQRVAAQVHLEESSADYPFSFERFLTDTIGAVQGPRGPDLRVLLDLARPMLRGLLDELDETAARDLADYDHLHEVRIVGKRLRYAMEIFADCFAPAFREQLYPCVEEMQEILGNANDSHVANGRLQTIRTHAEAMMPSEWRRLRPGIDGLLAFHRERLLQERQRFLEFWERWRQSGCKAAFLSLLKTESQVA
jgi:CHAD domain-containing protein